MPRIPRQSLVNPLKHHGGKSPLARRIVSLFPSKCKNPNKPDLSDDGYLHYVEPYFGGGSVLLENDPTGISEVANDANHRLMNFWSVLQNKSLFDAFHRIIEATPFAYDEFLNTAEVLAGIPPEVNFGAATGILEHKAALAVAQACAFFVRCRQSLAARGDDFSPLTKNRTRRGMNEQASAWLNSIDGLPAVHRRFRRVVLLNDKALTVIKKQDGLRTLFYLDPPYHPETRASTGEYGDFEMTVKDHLDLLDLLATVEGKFILSGYRNDLYDITARKNKWRRIEFNVPNHAAGGKSKRRMIECVWLNY